MPPNAEAASFTVAPLDGRQAYLANKRKATRSALLGAARAVFARSSYVDAKIDDIILAAGVSRATFYAHFESKLELAYAIYNDIAPQTNALFEALPNAASGGLSSLMAWLRLFSELHVEHRYVTPLLAQLQLFEPAFRARILRDSDEIIARLGVLGVDEVPSDPDLLRRWVDARLVFNQVAAVCAQIARGELPQDQAEITLEVTGRNLLRFFEAVRDHQTQ